MRVKLKLILVATTLLGCAKFVPPTGGERDITPPKLIDSNPENKSLNFSQKSIWLKFNEYVDSKDLKQELIITPEPNSRYRVKNKGDEILLEFEERLDSNTTYTFNFGAGIKDINERNKADQIKLVFSTGNKLDSLRIGGKVENLFTKEPSLAATVALYNVEREDSVIITRRKPTYFTKTDSSGNYLFENLKNGKYKMLAFTDANKNVRFDNKKELFGFKKDTISLLNDTLGVNISLFPYDTIPPKYKRYIQKETVYTLKFDEPLYKPKIAFLGDSVNYIVENDELRFFKGSNFKEDSIKVAIVLQDSLFNSSELLHNFTFRKTDESKQRKPEVVRFEINPNSGKPILQKEEYELKFDFPIIEIDSSKIKVSDDTLNNVDYEIYYSTRSQHTIGIKLKNEITKSVIIAAEPGAFVNINSDSTTAFTVRNPIVNLDETGLIEGIVKVEVTDSTQYIFQLIEAETNKVIREIINFENKFLFDRLIPNSYYVRVIIDTNFNGMWDTAIYKEGKDPEQIVVQQTPIKVKANFEFRDIIIENI